MIRNYLSQMSTRGGIVGLLFVGVGYVTGEITWQTAAWFGAATVASILIPEDKVRAKLKAIRGKDKIDAGV